MSNEEKLKKLAEMAEVVIQGGRIYAGVGPIWNPLTDMNQALECWRAQGSIRIIKNLGGGFSCTLGAVGFWNEGKTEAEALCNALLRSTLN